MRPRGSRETFMIAAVGGMWYDSRADFKNNGVKR